MGDPTFDRVVPLPTEQSEPVNADTRAFSSNWWSWFKMADSVLRAVVRQFPGEIISVEKDVSIPEGVVVLYPENRDYPILTNSPYAGTIVSTFSKDFAGTGTATFKKNGSSIGGTANSISTSEQVQTHGVDFDIGDDLSVTVSSASGDLEMAELRMNIVQKFNWLEYSGS